MMLSRLMIQTYLMRTAHKNYLPKKIHGANILQNSITCQGFSKKIKKSQDISGLSWTLFIFRDFLAPMQPPSRSLLTFIFDELKKIVLKWKIVQNYKTGGNYSKFIDIYNIVIDLDTRDDILPVMNPKRFSHT